MEEQHLSNSEDPGDLTGVFSISDFSTFMEIPLSYLRSKPISSLHVFSTPDEFQPKKRRNNFSNSFTIEKIKSTLELFNFIHFPTLIQFWSPTIIEGDQHFLDSSDLPFGLSVLRKGLCLFRKNSSKHRYTLEGEDCGPPGRVFRWRYPEFCPDVGFYSGKEFKLRDVSVRHGVRGYLAMPVFEPVWQHCIGVIELLTVMDGSYCLTDWIEKVSDSLQAVGLRSSDVFWPFNMKILACNQYENGSPELQLALDEMEKVLDVLCNMYKLPFAQTWIVTFDESSMESVISTTKKGSYMSINKVSSFQRDCIRFCLRKGQGIAWRAFLSSTSCFCRDITQLSLCDYALVLSARKADITGGFAICLQSTCTSKVVYIIELFLPPNQSIYREPWIFLNLLLATMKQQFKTFKLLSGEEVGKKLLVEVIKTSKDDPLDSFVACHTTPEIECLENQRNMENLTPCQHSILEVQTTKCVEGISSKKNNTASSSSVLEYSQDGEMVQLLDTAHKRRKDFSAQKDSIPRVKENGAVETSNLGEVVSAKFLGEQYEKRLKTVADSSSVSRSTSMNLSTQPSINRLTSCKKSEMGHSFAEHKCILETKKHIAKSSQRHELYPFSPAEENPASVACITPTATTMQRESFMTVKAEFKGDIIKFQLALSSGMLKLKDEVMKRLNLVAGSFETKYLNEDNNWILLNSDRELQEYMTTMRSLDIHTIKLSIESIVPNNEVLITVKAKYKEDLIKFELPHLAGMVELRDEMIKRLKLEAGSFRIKYADDENNMQTLLDSDAALQNCINTMNASQKTAMKLIIEPITAQETTNNEGIMTVKAFCKDDIMKFQLSLSSGMVELKNELTKRLLLETGSFAINYVDGDQNEILLDRDTTLTSYMSAMKSKGINTITIFLKPTEFTA